MVDVVRIGQLKVYLMLTNPHPVGPVPNIYLSAWLTSLQEVQIISFIVQLQPQPRQLRGHRGDQRHNEAVIGVVTALVAF